MEVITLHESERVTDTIATLQKQRTSATLGEKEGKVKNGMEKQKYEIRN